MAKKKKKKTQAMLKIAKTGAAKWSREMGELGGAIIRFVGSNHLHQHHHYKSIHACQHAKQKNGNENSFMVFIFPL